MLEEPRTDDPAERRSAGRGLARVLVVEDDDAQRRTLADILGDEQFEVRTSVNAAGAIKIVEQEEIAVAVVDDRLPDLNGRQLLKIIRALDGDVRVIIHTAFGSFESAKDAVNLGAFAYVEKVGDPEELIKHVHRAIQDRTSEELRQSEGRLRSITENAPDYIFQVDRDGTITFYNRSIPGYSAEEVLGSTLYDWVPESARRRVERVVQEVFASGEPQNYEAVSEDLAGNEVWYSGRIGPVVVDGRVINAVVIARDITERKRSEQTLRDNEARLRLMMEEMPAVIWATDRDLRFTSSQGAGLKKLDLEPGEVVGTTLQEFFESEDPEIPSIAAHYRALEGESVSFEQVWAGRTFHAHVQPLHDAEHEITGCIGLALDVTERKRAESLQAGQNRTLRLLATGRPLPEVLQELVHTIEEQVEGLRCSVLRHDDEAEDAERLRFAAAPSMPETFRTAIDRLRVGPNAASCGTAAYRGQRVIVEDVAADSLWSGYRQLGLEFGFRACWSQPILSHDGNLLGTFAMYLREPSAPEEAHLELLESAANLAGVAIAHAARVSKSVG